MGNRGLSESQKKILVVLIHVPEFQALNFYLARGAGLILYLSHRTSRDEDFFSQEQFQPEHFLAALSGHFQVQVLSREKGTLHLSLDGVLCSFFHYPYALIEKNLIDNMPVTSIPDIAAMKLSALVLTQQQHFATPNEISCLNAVDIHSTGKISSFPGHRIVSGC